MYLELPIIFFLLSSQNHGIHASNSLTTPNRRNLINCKTTHFWSVSPQTRNVYLSSNSHTRKTDLLAPHNLHFVKGIRRKFPLPRLRGLKTGLQPVSRLNSSQDKIYEKVFGRAKNFRFCFYLSWNSGKWHLYSSYSFKETRMLLFALA